MIDRELIGQIAAFADGPKTFEMENGEAGVPVEWELLDRLKTALARETATASDYDDMYHAIGRPEVPLHETYRNYFIVDAHSVKAKRFEDLGWWELQGYSNDGRDAVYSINVAGREALQEWMLEFGPGVPARGQPSLEAYSSEQKP